MQRSHRFGYLGLAFVVLGALLTACSGSDRPQDAVHVLTWDGEVNPVMQRYFKRGLESALDSHARALVLRLDTPGGFDSSMRAIMVASRLACSRADPLRSVAARRSALARSCWMAASLTPPAV